MKISTLSLGLLLLTSGVYAQKKNSVQITPTSAEMRWKGFEQRKKLSENSFFKNLEFRNIGPVSMSGRITDLDVNPENPNEFYAAYASGGLWYTNNSGTTFTPVFDREAVMTIGDIAVDWKKKTIWIGTGESNSSRSSYSGMGIYKSSDAGKTWQNVGLMDSHHIGKIIINPDNPDELWVAAVGHLYSSNNERGIFKTKDGGKTWKKTLFLNDVSGAIDVQINPKKPHELFAAIWHRERKASDFKESGKESGIYKSEDGGETWKLLTAQNSGFPFGETNGRIGLAIFPQNPEIMYAVLDNQAKRPRTEKEETVKKVLDKAKIKNISREEFIDLDEKDINAYLDEEGFPDKYTAKKLKQLLKDNKIKIQDIYNYTHNGNDDLFDIEIQGAEVYRSDNGGKSWKKTNEKNLDGLYYTYGYYFGNIYVSPSNPEKVIIGGVPLLMSENGGKNFKKIDKDNVHADHHAIWINPNDDKMMINGNDGGINMTYDNGKSWKKVNPIPVSQFYSIDYDMAIPYRVYGGMQDNGVWYGSSTNKFDYEEGQFYDGDGFKFLMGGDGMQARVDWRDNETVYTGFQFGNYFRINTKTGDRKYLEMPREIGEDALRFNWESPIQISRHSQDIIYFASQNVYRSMDKGENWTKISQDLTRNQPQGNVPFNTITNIEESPEKFGLLYAGTDDGLVWISKDGGNSWTKIMDKVGLWVSQLEPSTHSESRIYASLNGYREDHFEPYLFVSEDFGKTWTSISAQLPLEPINVIREDPKNENLLYVGTDNGLYISIDRGKSWMNANNSKLPNVAVHDLKIHHRDGDLIVGTHGRSIYIADIKLFQKLTSENASKNLIIKDLNEVRYNKNWGKSYSNYEDIRAQKYTVQFINKESGLAILKILNEKDEVLRILEQNISAGINSFVYDLSIDAAKAKSEQKKADDGKIYLLPSKYKAEICVNGTCEKRDFEVKETKPKTKREVPQGDTSPGEFKKWRREAGWKKTL